ncbi:THUMP domain-containing protein 3 [Tachyglossus aculeatus]|uniref:THUMP domain-containing protein 3 n=1 Tax=Tachyglossus aculeatus TaxID=9261 RepID=UPI0018F43BFC|nr:THUMP domain-containing protein 3 [Tachyglossus aculeatus]XP_038596064.1 THUMP domain-containing protein 3 [Tachyglossus aculeatus]
MAEVEETLIRTPEAIGGEPQKAADQSVKSSPEELVVTIGATVPTGFEATAADEVREKLASRARISRERGKIYFDISIEYLAQVHSLRSVDNLFVVVQEFRDYQFKETKEDTLKDFKELAGKLPWSNPLKVWERNINYKKKKTIRKKPQQHTPSQEKAAESQGGPVKKDTEEELSRFTENLVLNSGESQSKIPEETPSADKDEGSNTSEKEKKGDETQKEEAKAKVLKFRVTCNRAGDKHNFTSNEAARDFGGAVQDYFNWKADMTNFDVEVLLNIHQSEIIVGIALTEESLHRRNIIEFGPTTLRSTLAYGMLRLCSPQLGDVIVDPMCGSGAISIEGICEWPNCYHIAGDNNPLAVKRTSSNIWSLMTRNSTKERKGYIGLPVDSIQWDICSLPLRTSSVDIIVSDMPFGKRIGSRRRNWDLYPFCLQEMSRVCKPGTGRAILLTHDRKCIIKALSKMCDMWRKVQTAWVNIGGLHAAVYLLKRTPQVFIQTGEQEKGITL